MSILSDDPLTQLAFTVYEGKGVYALLLGSGLSRAADIPTGWEITLDLVRRVALAQGVPDQADWAAWYRQQEGQDPNYSTLLEGLAASPDERRSIIHSYIEPTDEDREEGRRVPTAAHHAIADLVGNGFIRVIVTTNFDRLMENALRERGIEPTVVASVDALAGAEPLTHSACYILKLHGDYKDARILNIEAELSSYPEQYNALLDRIVDEHGLIICGWSGEWDHALRAAILRAPNRRYSTFWAARGQPGERARELIDHRRGCVVPIGDANGFFTSLCQRVETLRQTHRQNPLSIDLLVNSAKRYLAKHEHRIQLDDLFDQERGRALGLLDDAEFSSQAHWSQAELRRRVSRYEAVAEPLSAIAGLAGRWGDDSEFSLMIDTIRSLNAQAKKTGGGQLAYLELRTYPAVLLFTAYGLGLTRAERWGTLHRLFDAKIQSEYSEPSRLIESFFLWSWEGGRDEIWHHVEGLERRKTPVSDHLFNVFSAWSKRFIGLVSDFNSPFDRFETLGSLAYLENADKVAIQEGIARNQREGWTTMPVGRGGWRYSRKPDRATGELQSDPLRAALLKAGFGKGDPEFIDAFALNYQVLSRKMRF